MRRGDKGVGRQPFVVDRAAESVERIVDAFIAEPEGAEVNRQAADCFEVPMGDHRVRRAHVDLAHEPLGLVGTDGQEGEAGRTEATADRREMVGMGGVACEEDHARRARQGEAAPEGPIPVEETAPGKVLCGRRGDPEPGVPGHRSALPPVELVHLGESGCFDPAAVAEPGHDRWLVGIRQSPQCRQIHVVVVVVAEQNEVDGGQIVEAQPGWAVALRAGEGYGTDPLGPDGVGQHVEAVHLDEDGCVIDPGDPQATSGDRSLGGRAGRLVALRPGCRAAPKRPSQHVAGAGVPDAGGVSKPALFKRSSHVVSLGPFAPGAKCLGAGGASRLEQRDAMTYIEPTEEQMAAFARSGVEGPIHMLNLLKLKPAGGAASYAKYAKHTAPCLEKVGGKVVYQAEGRAAVIGPDQWDLILIVEYPSVAKFMEMVTSEQYLKGVHLRSEALADSRLVCMQAGVATGQ